MKRGPVLLAAGFLAGALSTAGVFTAYTSKQPAPSPVATPSDVNPYEMSFKDLTQSLGQKQGDDLDHYALYYLLSIDQSTIGMMRRVEQEAKHPELKAFTTRLIQEREAEVDQMYAWQKAWGYTHH